MSPNCVSPGPSTCLSTCISTDLRICLPTNVFNYLTNCFYQPIYLYASLLYLHGLPTYDTWLNLISTLYGLTTCLPTFPYLPPSHLTLRLIPHKKHRSPHHTYFPPQYTPSHSPLTHSVLPHLHPLHLPYPFTPSSPQT